MAGRERATAQDDWCDHRPQRVVDVVDLKQRCPASLALIEMLIHSCSITTGQRVADVGTELAPRFTAFLVVSGREVLLEERLPQSLLGAASPERDAIGAGAKDRGDFGRCLPLDDDVPQHRTTCLWQRRPGPPGGMLFGVDRGNVSGGGRRLRLQIGGLIGERDAPLVGSRRIDGEPAHRAEQIGPERLLRALSGLDYPQYAVVALTDQVVDIPWVGDLRGHPACRGLVAGPQFGVRRVVAGADCSKQVGVALLDVGVSTRVHTLHTNRRFGGSDRSRRECPERGETTWSRTATDSHHSTVSSTATSLDRPDVHRDSRGRGDAAVSRSSEVTGMASCES